MKRLVYLSLIVLFSNSLFAMPYNNILFSAFHKENKEFEKKEQKNSDLHYFKARYYNADVGRFLSPDPHTLNPRSLELNDPQTLNPYVYCTNNPNKYVDPNGKFRVYAFANWNTSAKLEYTYQFEFTSPKQEIGSPIAKWIIRRTPIGKVFTIGEYAVKAAEAVGAKRAGAGRIKSLKDPVKEFRLEKAEAKTDPKAEKIYGEKFGKNQGRIGPGISRKEAEGFLEEVEDIEGAENLYEYDRILDQADQDADRLWWNKIWDAALEKE